MTLWKWWQFFRLFGFGPISAILLARSTRRRIINGEGEFDPPISLVPRWHERTWFELLVLTYPVAALIGWLWQ